MEIHGGFRHVSARHRLHVLDSSSMTIKTHHWFDLLAVRRERFFERSYIWTGSGVEKDPLILSGVDELGHATHRLHGPVLHKGTHRTFLVDLGRHLEAGDQVKVEISHVFVDAERKFVPKLGQNAYTGIEDIRLEVLLPESFSGDVKWEQYDPGAPVPTVRGLIAEQSEWVEGVKSKKFAHRVEEPVVGNNYAVTWPRRPVAAART